MRYRWLAGLPPALLAACAFSMLAGSPSLAQDFAVPMHWIDGLPSDEVYVSADPLGLDAHQLAMRPLGTADVQVVVASRDEPRIEKPEFVIPAEPMTAEPAKDGTADAPRPGEGEPPARD